MGFFIIFNYIVSFIVLLAIHAPWWAWLIYVGSALFWFVVWTLIDGRTNEKKQPQKRITVSGTSKECPIRN